MIGRHSNFTLSVKLQCWTYILLGAVESSNITTMKLHLIRRCVILFLICSRYSHVSPRSILSLPAQNVSLSRADKLRREKENGKATEEVVHA